jgi:hypothetical protein
VVKMALLRHLRRRPWNPKSFHLKARSLGPPRKGALIALY